MPSLTYSYFNTVKYLYNLFSINSLVTRHSFSLFFKLIIIYKCQRLNSSMFEHMNKT